MKKLDTPQELDAWRESCKNELDHDRLRLRVCDGTGCRALGSQHVLTALRQAVNGNNVEIMTTGCPGFCEQGPLVTVDPQQIAYQQVTTKHVHKIISDTLGKGEVISELLYVDPSNGQPVTTESELPYYKSQMRRVTDLNGQIDPHQIEHYIAHKGYMALSKALYDMSPDGIIEEVIRSQLRGRGGAGFPTGVKWKFCRQSPGDEKYVICNADEGNPGAFTDRSLLEANPHRIIEGMIIGARGIGATEGFIYIRSEYPLAIENLNIALNQAREHGLLGKNILGSGFDFNIQLRLGAGAFVCGEETALMASIEGKPGEPRPRPPFPAQEGLWGKPSNINNVKSWASIPSIIANGAEWFAGVGTEKSKGTAMFSMVGKINNPGVVEVPIGISLRELIFDAGGGIPDGKSFKAVQFGGPLGGCIPAQYLDTPIDYESLTDLGATMGSGGLVVADESTCMVDLARYFMNFTQEESCGQCIPCRWGTKVMLDILTRICNGQGEKGDIETLEQLANTVKTASLCGLGQAAPNPVLSSLRHFRDEYEAHVYDKRCPSKVCWK